MLKDIQDSYLGPGYQVGKNEESGELLYENRIAITRNGRNIDMLHKCGIDADRFRPSQSYLDEQAPFFEEEDIYPLTSNSWHTERQKSKLAAC